MLLHNVEAKGAFHLEQPNLSILVTTMNVQFEWPRKYVTITLPSARSTAPMITAMQSISSGGFVFTKKKFICINQLRNTQSICVSTEDVVSFGSLSMSQTSQSNESFIPRQIMPDRKDTIALKHCAIHAWYNKLKCPDLFYIYMWTTYQLRLNKYYTKVRTTTIMLNFDQI